jgi:hypothetical protein
MLSASKAQGKLLRTLRTNAADGGATPKQEALRFVSFAPHRLPIGGRTAGRFSEGIFGSIPKMLIFRAQLLSLGLSRNDQHAKISALTGNPESTRGT